MNRIFAAAMAAAFALASAQAAAGAFVNGRWNPDAPSGSFGYDGKTYTRDEILPYEDVEPVTLNVNGGSVPALSYQAQWVGWENDDGNFLFFKPSEKNDRRFWLMFSAAKGKAPFPRIPGAKSAVLLYEIDCARKATASVKGGFYSGYLGKGEVLSKGDYSGKPLEWETWNPRSHMAAWAVLFCPRQGAEKR